jgi:hypothetical protein
VQYQRCDFLPGSLTVSRVLSGAVCPLGCRKIDVYHRQFRKMRLKEIEMTWDHRVAEATPYVAVVIALFVIVTTFAAYMQ